MLIVRSVPDLREALRTARREERSIGLVPTMGALHDGHLSLLRRARLDCAIVVMSLFVNPRQFDASGDLARYPRDEARDVELAAAAGVDLVFAPSPAAIYPPGFATTVSVAGPAEGLESEHRGASHFAGVATIVCKLLNMVGPRTAYFGAKDAQQAAVVRRLVRDLDIDTEIVVSPTVREPDGLAMSSRNALLSPGERARATALSQALRVVGERARAGERDPAAAIVAGRALLVAADAELEYLTFVDPVTMTPLERLDGDALAVIAARIGAVRLIDNLAVSTADPEGAADPLTKGP